FTAVFAIIGLIISLAFGILGGNRLVPLILTALVCTLIGGGIGAGAFKVIEMQVPEILEIFSGEGTYLAEDSLGADYDGEGGSYESDLEDRAMSSVQGDSVEEGSATQSTPKHFGDHIMVGDIQIKNEPRLIAAAIQTMLAKDEQ
ncbi:MAG: hypothetical protein KDK39_17290, partial [Leptospiraceae bacterium]|nr:hypothetical protein [Leptospiraceae bacterium]